MRLLIQLRQLAKVSAADGGGMGRQFNRQLLGRIKQASPQTSMYSMFYATAGSAPTRDGLLWAWTVDRSDSIGTLFGRIRMALLRWRLASLGGHRG